MLHIIFSHTFLLVVISDIFKVDDVDPEPKPLPSQIRKRNSIFHQHSDPGWSRGKRVSISYTTQQADVDSPQRPRKVLTICYLMIKMRLVIGSLRQRNYWSKCC